MDEYSNKIFTKQMSYECREKNSEDNRGHLEGAGGGDSGGPGGECGAGGGGKGGRGVVAPADADGLMRDGGVRKVAPSAGGRRKAFMDAMAWLFDPGKNPDAWMLRDAGMNWPAQRR